MTGNRPSPTPWTPGPWVSHAVVHDDGEHADLTITGINAATVRLIGSAPELAELLDRLRMWLDDYYTDAPPEFEHDVAAATDLLARCRGEADA